jgi:hypothetical protein
MTEREIKFLNQNDASLLVNSITELKHKCLILLMLDSGLRVSETITLKFKAFDFKKKTVTVQSLKKRKMSKDFQSRKIPLSQRLFLCLADYANTFPKVDGDTYLFPSPSDKRNHLARDAVFKILKRLSIKKLNIQNLHPHTLRHTFATSLVATGANLHEVADLLGHQNLDTSRIYTHIPQDKLQKSINAAATRRGEKRSFFRNLFSFLYAKRPPVVYIPNQKAVPVVGRGSELTSISQHLATGTNVIVLGQPGTGKRLLLDSIKTNKKVLTFDDTGSIKQSLIYMLLYLYDTDFQNLAAIIFKKFDKETEEKEFDRAKEETRLSRQSIGHLCDLIKSVVQPKQYILKIKQFDNISKQALKVIDNLKDTFVILTSATEISITKSNFFWNFEKIEIKNLNRLQSFEMIHKLSYDLVVDDYEIYRNHIWQQTAGNPKAVSEMIERYRREPKLATEIIRAVTFSGAIKDWDCTMVVVGLMPKYREKIGYNSYIVQIQ